MEKIHAIGITGGIGAGKSVVSRILRLNGFTVFDCDSEARLLMENDSRLR
ncbi:MAG: dephospho-CoA kinase, partial [Muribaculaceae bacterium]|nr:dephospho-CoA kinase [Muribaculaceae bacterium]